MFRSSVAALFSIGIGLTAAACSGGPASPNSPAQYGSAMASGSKIQHIVIVMQEARSFDDLFCSYPGADGACRNGTISLEAKCTISDTFADYQRDRKTGKFDKERADCPGHRHPEYAHVPSSELKAYYAIAQQYVLGDKMFSSTGNPTFEAHQYVIAAQAASALDQPFGKVQSDGCVYSQWVQKFGGGKIPACFSYDTIADLLTLAGLTSNYYYTPDDQHPIVSTWDAFGWIKGASSGTAPSTSFISDVASGNLATVTWVTPAFANSDLSGSRSSCGPKWVASIVNAVGQSQFWSSSAIVILWSGFGGWYDHVPPPFENRDGLGFRVPVLVVSPYALNGAVVHTQFETASVLRFVEDTFGLQSLAAADARATSIGSSTLDENQTPRPFVPIAGGSGC